MLFQVHLRLLELCLQLAPVLRKIINPIAPSSFQNTHGLGVASTCQQKVRLLNPCTIAARGL